MSAEVLMATPRTNSLGGESGGYKHEGCVGRRLCWKCATVSWSTRTSTSTPERAGVDVDVDPERRSPRYHETCLALESVEESSAAVGNLWPALHLQSVNT